MHLIAICDDERKELEKAKNLLTDYERHHPELRFTIRCFESARELLCRTRESGLAPDLFLLDVYMPEMLGTETARKLRDMGSKGSIIFLTSSTDHALDAFRVEAMQYLVKPILKKDLFSALDRFLRERAEKEKNRKKYLLLRIDGMIHRICLETIVSLEAQGKRQFLHLDDGAQFVLHMTMTELNKPLSPFQEFVKVGAAYIVNLQHVDSLNSQSICLDTGRSIYLPRGSYQSLREQYFQYYFEDYFEGGSN